MKSKSLVAFEVYPCCSGKDVILSDSIFSFFFLKLKKWNYILRNIKRRI